ncbi:hypothetical protein CW697_00880 [Macrococcoides caseolyticum]|uniref:NUMOD4 domain-containing protein n=1 Tax=Macrococcoides caseolyticum TaxID=69966 RepID=UPI000C324566|nr:NUMOD4 domain-containing protein [Macrococcus caseolyticus]PKF31004.1 hypothetical protein CW697_00880 [Macrococcus caseolyticus]
MIEYKPIKGFEKEYGISESGKVKNFRSGKLLKQSVSKGGYPVVSLWKMNKGNTKTIHRLLAECYIPPYFGETVNHIDGNKQNNILTNLEWATYSENNQHAYHKKLKSATHLNANHLKTVNKGNSYRSIPIEVYSLDDVFLGRFKSIKDVCEKFNISRKPVYQGLRKQVKPFKYKFKYVEELNYGN